MCPLHITETLQIKSIQDAGAETKSDDGPRIFALHKYVCCSKQLYSPKKKERKEL